APGACAGAQGAGVGGAAWVPRRLSPAGAGLLVHGSSPSGLAAGSHGGAPDPLGGRCGPARVIGVSGDLGIWNPVRRASSAGEPPRTAPPGPAGPAAEPEPL